MKPLPFLIIVTFLCLSINPQIIAGKKKKKSKKPSKSSEDEYKEYFENMKLMKCLVCQNLVTEFETAIMRTDPKRKIDTPVSYRDKKDGIVRRKIIPYARSQMHLIELTENICRNFEDYALAKVKETGKSTIIRVTNADGNMNPKIDSFDIVPDKNLERLTNLCETIVEEMDEQFLELFADEKNSPVIGQKICFEESGYCKNLRDEL